MNRAIAAILVVVSLSLAAPAGAWEPIASSRPVWRLPVPYALHQAGSVDLGGFTPTETELRRGMDDWTRVSCTNLRTNYRGTTTARAGASDGQSVIGWVESRWPHSGSAIGVTGPRWNPSNNTIGEADMEMNAVNFTWTTTGGSFSNVNAYSIILHEGGHYFGLGHSNVRGTSMWPRYEGGVIGLAADDEAGICALYPGSNSTNCTTTGCPNGQECQGGSCVSVNPAGGICSPCQSASDCTEGRCVRYADGQSYCTRTCRSDTDCGGQSCSSTPVGMLCVRYEGGNPMCVGGMTSNPGCTNDSQCAANQLCNAGMCVPRPTTGADLGQPCGSDAACRSGVCLGGTCSQSCDWLNPSSCPSGFYCDGDASTNCSVGYCVAGAAGNGALGGSCAVDTDCASLHCDDGVCSEPCTPGGVAGCGAGFACEIGDSPCRGSCRVSASLGDECEINDDCGSGLCAVQGDRSFCTRRCGPQDACPSQFTCASLDANTSICVPDAGGLGEVCASNDECLSGLCAADGNDTYCTRICDAASPCPSAYACAPTAGGPSVCRPIAEATSGGCGCRAAGVPREHQGLAWLGLLGLVFAWTVRRARR